MIGDQFRNSRDHNIRLPFSVVARFDGRRQVNRSSADEQRTISGLNDRIQKPKRSKFRVKTHFWVSEITLFKNRPIAAYLGLSDDGI